MNSEQKNKLFEEHIEQIENEFLQAVPEMKHRLGEMEKPPDNQYAIFEIPMNDVIPNMNLTVACEGVWETGVIQITHYKMEEQNEDEALS